MKTLELFMVPRPAKQGLATFFGALALVIMLTGTISFLMDPANPAYLPNRVLGILVGLTAFGIMLCFVERFDPDSNGDPSRAGVAIGIIGAIGLLSWLDFRFADPDWKGIPFVIFQFALAIFMINADRKIANGQLPLRRMPASRSQA